MILNSRYVALRLKSTTGDIEYLLRDFNLYRVYYDKCRGVPPTVYFIFKELYGVKPGTREICRYIVDIYAPPVSDDHYVKSTANAVVRIKFFSFGFEL